MAGLSPTQRTMKLLRDQGVTCWPVERFISLPNRHGYRVDLFSIIDLLAISQHTTLGIQSCGSGFSAHLNKLTVEKSAESIEWLNGPRQLFLYGWRKVKYKRGSAALRWRPRIAEIRLDGDDLVFEEIG